MENYGTMENYGMWTKLRYYTENYGTSIYEEKHMVDYQKLRNFDLQWKKTMEIYQKYIFKQIFSFRT